MKGLSWPLRKGALDATSPQSVSYGEVNAAFMGKGAVFDEPDERLIEYLRVLCSTQIESEPNRLLANTRCVTINAILVQRFMERTNRATTRLTWIVIILMVVTIVATFA